MINAYSGAIPALRDWLDAYEYVRREVARSRREFRTLDMTQPWPTQEAIAIIATLKVNTNTAFSAAAVATDGPI